ncbi:hypothetical protein [Aeromonas veronii]|uniref:hypothetical protein n=1 Tax=Aeromonas veronii TaxID=654 RepID=UPI0039F70A3F
MTYKVYSGEFLASHGYPVLIVTYPIASADKYISECHSFFSGNPETYSLSECEYDAEDKDHIDDESLMTAFKQHGENQIHDHLSKVSSLQYQAMLAGFGYKITESEKNWLLQLHLRNFLSKEIETKIVHNSKDNDLKDFLRSIANLGRITTRRKI